MNSRPSTYRAYNFSNSVPQRVRVNQNYSDQIYNYGLDNVYPQKVLEIKRSSGITSQACQLYADFLYGNGLASEELQNVEVNKRGETVNDLLEKIVQSYSVFNGVTLHLGWNILGQINKISVIPFQNCRLGSLEGKKAYQIAIWDNWANESYKNTHSTKQDIIYLDCAKDLSEEEFDLQLAAAGGFKDYRGSIMYLSAEGFYRYPYATFDPVLNDAKTDTAYSSFRYRNVKNNFNPSAILRFFGRTTEEEEEKILEQLKNHQGDENAGNLLALFGQAKDSEGNPTTDVKVEQLEHKGLDDLYVNQEKSVNRNIVSVFRQPKVLHSLDDKGIFNAETLKEAYTFYNEITRKQRRFISAKLQKIFENSVWSEVTDNYSILDNTYNA